MCKRSLAWCLQLSKTRQNVKTVLVRLVFPINAHQNVNQKPIGSMPAYQAQCTLPPQPIYLTLLFDFLRVWFRDYLLVAYALKYEYGTKGVDSLLLGVPPLVYILPRLTPIIQLKLYKQSSLHSFLR